MRSALYYGDRGPVCGKSRSRYAVYTHRFFSSWTDCGRDPRSPGRAASGPLGSPSSSRIRSSRASSACAGPAGPGSVCSSGMSHTRRANRAVTCSGWLRHRTWRQAGQLENRQAVSVRPCPVRCHQLVSAALLAGVIPRRLPRLEQPVPGTGSPAHIRSLADLCVFWGIPAAGPQVPDHAPQQGLQQVAGRPSHPVRRGQVVLHRARLRASKPAWQYAAPGSRARV